MDFDGILVLLLLIALAIPILLIVVLVGQSNLRARLGRLERAFREQRAALAAGQAAGVGQSPQDAQAPHTTAPAIGAKLAPPQKAIVVAEKAADPVLVSQVVSPFDLEKSGMADFAARAQAGAGAQADAGDQNRPLVMRSDRFGDLMAWLIANWVYAVSALSLALAGVFFVQYGMEKGLLPPGLRVLFALLFGAGLIAGGEWLRRKSGDGVETATAYLPSVFAGAGVVTLFAAIVAARQLYNLIGPQTAFGAEVAVAVLAIGLGWFYGPLLVAVGLLGAAAAPFIVGGNTDAGPWLYAYFAVMTALGLTVDAIRRWAWVSVLALGLGYGTGWLTLTVGAGVLGWIAFCVVLALLAVILPMLSLTPRHAGPSTLQSVIGRGAGWPIFPTRLAMGAAVASTFGLMTMAQGTSVEAMLALAALTLLALAYLIWADRAEGLADLAALPAAGFLASLAMQGFGSFPIWREFAAQASENRLPEVGAPMTVTWILGLAVAISAGFALRSMRDGPLRIAYGLGAVLVAPVAVAILELLWQPALVLGPYPWALHAIAIAGAMVLLAARYAKGDGADHRRMAYATLSALSLIALSLFVLTTASALTLALAVLVVVAAGLDRRFDLPEMGYFLQLGTAVLGYRLLADPGVGWALETPLWPVVATFTGVIAALIAAYWLIRPLDRLLPKGVLESAIAGFAAIFVNVLITRWLGFDAENSTLQTHWGVTLNAMPWLVLMLMQLYRAQLGGPLLRLRQAIAVVAGLIATATLGSAVFLVNPLFSTYPDDPGFVTSGPYVLDSLFLAYFVPGLVLLVAAWKLSGIGRLRYVFIAVGGALAALYAGLEIRRIWQGDWIGYPLGVMQGELYTYTVALMVLGAVLLYQAIAARSVLLRRIAMAVIAVTVAKVFLLDAAGLTGLTRVISFAGLGLSLAALAWLNRWAGQVSEK